FADPRHLQALRISIPNALIADSEKVTRAQNAIVDKLMTISGVSSVGFASAMPMEGFDFGWDQIYVEGKTYADNVIPPLRLYKYVSPDFLRTSGTRLVVGREMTWSEIYGLRPVAMISENLARELWGTADAALGKHIREIPSMPWFEIVGVVQDIP